MNLLELTSAIEAAHWLKHRSMQASFLSDDSLLHLRPHVAMHVCLFSSKAGSTIGSSSGRPGSLPSPVPVSPSPELGSTSSPVPVCSPSVVWSVYPSLFSPLSPEAPLFVTLQSCVIGSQIGVVDVSVDVLSTDDPVLSEEPSPVCCVSETGSVTSAAACPSSYAVSDDPEVSVYGDVFVVVCVADSLLSFELFN